MLVTPEDSTAVVLDTRSIRAASNAPAATTNPANSEEPPFPCTVTVAAVGALGTVNFMFAVVGSYRCRPGCIERSDGSPVRPAVAYT